MFDVLPVDALTHKCLLQFRKEVLRRVAVCLVSHEVDVISLGCVFDSLDGLPDDQFAVVPMFRLFEVGRSGVVVNAVRDRFSIVIMIVTVRITRHRHLTVRPQNVSGSQLPQGHIVLQKDSETVKETE
jgi:hypothetical protein